MATAPPNPQVSADESIQDEKHFDDVSPNHEVPYSAALSCVFHCCLLLLIALLADILQEEEAFEFETGIVNVTDASATSNADAGADLSDANVLENNNSQDDTALPENQPQESIDNVNPANVNTNISTTSTLQNTIANADATAAAIADRVRGLKSQLANAADSNGGGAPAPPGGSGRSGRAARWVLRFDTSSPKNYATQLGKLGAEVAFPTQGEKWRYFTDLAGSPSGQLRDLAEENRIYWVDQDPSSYLGVAQLLGQGNPPLMAAFLPLELEQKMLRIELAYGGAKEEEILSTQFRVVPRGGKLNIVVVDQTLR